MSNAKLSISTEKRLRLISKFRKKTKYFEFTLTKKIFEASLV